MKIHKKKRKAKKINPRPKIEYPPLTTKTWIPPDERPKKKKPGPKYIKPPEMSVRLEISSLQKIWHNFIIFEDRAILTGSYSQYYKKYSMKSNGYQAPCNCVVAITFAKLFDITKWSAATLDKILDTGDYLYLRTLSKIADKYKKILKLSEVYHTYYIDNIKVTMEMKGKKYVGKMLPDLDDTPHLAEILKEFFQTYQSGILIVEQKFFALFVVKKGYYFFDPLDHEKDGTEWKGLQGLGFSLLAKVLTSASLVPLVLDNLKCVDNPKVTLVPCNILRKFEINKNYPSCMEDANLELKFPPTKDKVVDSKKDEIIIEAEAVYVEEMQDDDDDDEIEELPQEPPEIDGGKGDAAEEEKTDAVQTQTHGKPECKAPVEKVKAASVTYFIDIVPDKVGILRASTHQCDPKFTKYLGKQSIANAVAAVGMLRLYKSKYWTSNILDEVLKLGEIIYHDSMKALRLSGDSNLKVTTVCKIFTVNEKEFTPKIEEFSLVGKLNSQTDDMLDLLPALKEFLSDNDACILYGPLILAVWTENQVFYMFDPNERDNKGLVIVKQVQMGSFLKVYDVAPGVACLTWYTNLKDLVDVYMKNVPKTERRDQFVLCKIQVLDYVPLPEPWYSFQPLSSSKWILKGNFSQNNKKYDKETRNTQCTAMATMAIAMKEIKPLKEWDSETLDKILDHGDRYYANCINSLKEKDKFVSRLLMMVELLPKHFMDTYEINFEIDECLVNGNLSYPDNHEIPNLKIGFKNFFEDCDAGVLTCRNISMAVWKQDEVFYYFDSHSRNDEGLATYYGTSMVIRVLTMEELIRVILANLGADTNSQYNISRVVAKLIDAESGIPKPPLNNFEPLENNMAILRSSISENDDKFKINRGKQTIPNTLVALGMTQVYPTAIWTKDILDEVLNIGDKLYVESMEAVIEAEEKKKEEEVAPTPAPPVPPPPPPEPEPEPVKGRKGKAKKEEPPPPPPPPPEPEPEPAVVEEKEDSDDITSAKVLKEFTIGVNKFEVELGDPKESTAENPLDLFYTLEDIYSLKPVLSMDIIEGETTVPLTPPQPVIDDDDNKQTLLESDFLNVIMWKEDDIYYIFDPKPRDPGGKVYGNDEWSTVTEERETSSELESEETASVVENEDEKADHREFMDEEIVQDNEAETEKIPTSKLKTKKPQTVQTQAEENAPDRIESIEFIEEGREADLYEAEDFEEEQYDSESFVEPKLPKHSSSYWREQEKEGKACVLRFLHASDMIHHVLDNTPPKNGKGPFKLIPISLTTKVKVKDTYDPELGPPGDKYSGDWKGFKEIDHGRWILRGTMNDTNDMFPAVNRGRQFVAISFTALAFVTLYCIPKFTSRSVDDIIMYGDRLHTFTLYARKKELKELKEFNLSDNEINLIVQSEEMGILNTTKHFCISTDKVKLEIAMDVVQGEINAQELEDVFDVKRGLEEFFHQNKMGIVTAKDQLLAIWRRGPIFYMFDSHSRGPSGLACVNGVACITRYLDINDLAEVFLQNLCKEGDNRFFVHAVTITVDPCPREEVRKKKPKVQPIGWISSFIPIVPGKTIVRGTISQEHQMFGRRLNSQFAPMAFVALAMTLVHRSIFWTKPIIDEIIIIGDQLYGTTLDNLGFEFNPWEETLTLDDTPTDFKIGELKANCELRPYDQRGILNIKNSNVLNLRQGLEKFFEENTHGVIETQPLTLAVWEENEPKRTFYLFDSCSRGPTGMPLANGAACALTFDSAKLLADHFISLIPESADADFTIRPVEVVVDKMKSACKKKKKEAGLQHDNIFVVGVKANSPCGKKCEKNTLKHLEIYFKRMREEQRLQKLGRKRFYNIPGTEIAILRGNVHEGSGDFHKYSRGKQDIPICLTSYVMERLLPFDKWTCKIINMVLDIGDQLYKDSYVMYKPKDDKLGLCCVVREIIIKDILVTIAIGKPVLISQFSQCKLATALELCFRQKNFCMVSIDKFYVAFFCKDDVYYLFDPHAINLQAKRKKNDGTAVLLKSTNLNVLAQNVVDNYRYDNEEANVFSIILVAIKSIRRIPKRKSDLLICPCQNMLHKDYGKPLEKPHKKPFGCDNM